MIEFGSDFHKCDDNFKGSSILFDKIGNANLYSCGRHAIQAIISQEKWKRIWMPAYFCYTVIEFIKNLGIEVIFYNDHPLSNNDNIVVRQLPYKNGDVLFRTDYFGLRDFRSNKGISVPVIEDHTHGLITDWCLNSDADWCVASLRKILPIASGGVLWSPKKLPIPQSITSTEECENMASLRYDAMSLKKNYLVNGGNKENFRIKYINTEEQIDNLNFSGIDDVSKNISENLDIKKWTENKLNNWNNAVEILSDNIQIIGVEKKCSQAFSLVLLAKSKEEREKLRNYLIQNSVYPAILWKMPEDTTFTDAKDFSDRMLSIHCDARYDNSDIKQLCNIINGFYNK